MCVEITCVGPGTTTLRFVRCLRDTPGSDFEVMFKQFIESGDGLLQNVVSIADGLRIEGVGFQAPSCAITFTGNPDTKDHPGGSADDLAGPVVNFNVQGCSQVFGIFLTGAAPTAVRNKFLFEGFSGACNGFVAACHVLRSSTLSAPKIQWQSEVENSSDLTKRILGEDVATGLYQELQAIVVQLKSGKSIEKALDNMLGSKAAISLLTIASACFQDADTLEAPGLVSAGQKWSLQTFELAVKVQTHVFQVLCLMSFMFGLLDGVGTDAGTIVRVKPEKGNGPQVLAVNPVLQLALEKACELCDGTWHCLRSEFENQSGVIHATISLGSLSQAMECISEVWVRKVENDMVKGIVERIAIEADVTQKATPVWSHIVSSTKYNQSLGKRQLLLHPCREKMPGMISDLHNLVKTFSEMSQMLQNKVAVTELSEIQVAEAVLDHATESMTVIAAINVVEELGKTRQGKTMAELVWKNGGKNIPGPLKTKLEAIVNFET